MDDRPASGRGSDGVDRAASVGVDEATEEVLGLLISHDLELPRLQLDSACVLRTRASLREEAPPVLRVGAHVFASLPSSCARPGWGGPSAWRSCTRSLRLGSPRSRRCRVDRRLDDEPRRTRRRGTWPTHRRMHERAPALDVGRSPACPCRER